MANPSRIFGAKPLATLVDQDERLICACLPPHLFVDERSQRAAVDAILREVREYWRPNLS